MKDILISMIESVCGKDLFAGIKGILTVDPFTKYSRAAAIVTSLYDAVITIAMMLVFIYFITAIVDKMTSENFQWEQFWRQLAMFLAAKVFIEHGLDIMKLMSAMGSEMVGMVNGSTTFSSALDAEAIMNDFLNGLSGVLKIIGPALLFGYLLIPFLLSWVMGIMVKVICYSRLIEILIRAAFAPIALSDFFKNGFQGGGWRWLKSFLAVCMQGAVIFGIAVLFSALLGDFIGAANGKDFFAFTGIYFAVGCSAIMLMFRSLSLCKELVGVN